MITAAGDFRIEVVTLTSASGTGYSSSCLTGEVTTGTLITGLQVVTASTNVGAPQGPGHTGKVAVYLYNGATYYEFGAFDLKNLADAYQWSASPTDFVFPTNTWAFRFASRQSALLAGCELHLTIWGRDIS